MHFIKPKKLKHGDVIGICSPASPPQSEEKLNRGISYLERIGFRVELGKHIFKKYGYLAGSDKERAADLNNLFSNPKVKAIFTTRGGYGSQRILSILDYRTIRRNPKILVGYSDITALHLALLSKAGLITFSGPMVTVQMSSRLKGKVEEQFWDMLMSSKIPKPMQSASSLEKILASQGKASGRLIGGNLSVLTELVGTQFFPNINKSILIVEEVDERPYRIDRMLQHIRYSGIYKNIRGIALGKFVSCKADKKKPTLTLKHIFRDTFSDSNIPIVSGFRFGHIQNSECFPIGVQVHLDGNKKIIKFLESGVTK